MGRRAHRVARCCRARWLRVRGRAVERPAPGDDADRAGRTRPPRSLTQRTAPDETAPRSIPSRRRDATAPGGREVIAKPDARRDHADRHAAGDGARPRGRAGDHRSSTRRSPARYCRRFHAETFPELKRELHRHGQGALHPARVPDRQDVGHGHDRAALRQARDKYFDALRQIPEPAGAWVSQEVRLDPIFKVAAQVGMTRAAV